MFLCAALLQWALHQRSMLRVVCTSVLLVDTMRLPLSRKAVGMQMNPLFIEHRKTLSLAEIVLPRFISTCAGGSITLPMQFNSANAAPGTASYDWIIHL